MNLSLASLSRAARALAVLVSLEHHLVLHDELREERLELLRRHVGLHNHLW